MLRDVVLLRYYAGLGLPADFDDASRVVQTGSFLCLDEGGKV